MFGTVTPIYIISPPAPPAPSTHPTPAPTAFHNPLSARLFLPSTARRCGRGRLSGLSCWSTAAARRPAPGRAQGQRGGYSRSKPSSAYRPRRWKCRSLFKMPSSMFPFCSWVSSAVNIGLSLLFMCPPICSHGTCGVSAFPVPPVSPAPSL